MFFFSSQSFLKEIVCIVQFFFILTKNLNTDCTPTEIHNKAKPTELIFLS